MPTYPDAVLDAHAARAVVGDRALYLAARLHSWWLGPRDPWSVIAGWVGVPVATLRDWCGRPEWAQACAQAVEPVLTRIARDAAFGKLDPVLVARDAAFLAATGQPAALEDGLPSAFLAARPAPVPAELKDDLLLAALDLGITEDVARLIRDEQRRAEQEPDYTIARALVDRCERTATAAGWRAIERRDVGETLTGAARNALYHARHRWSALGLSRAWFAS